MLLLKLVILFPVLLSLHDIYPSCAGGMLAVRKGDSELVNVSYLVIGWLHLFLGFSEVEEFLFVNFVASVFFIILYGPVDAGEHCALDAPEHNCCELPGKQCIAPSMTSEHQAVSWQAFSSRWVESRSLHTSDITLHYLKVDMFVVHLPTLSENHLLFLYWVGECS